MLKAIIITMKHRDHRFSESPSTGRPALNTLSAGKTNLTSCLMTYILVKWLH